MIASIILLFVLLILSGVFSASEIAFFSVSNIRVRHLVEKKVKNSQLLMELKDDPHKILSTILICNNVVNIGASAIATKVGLDIFLMADFTVRQSVQLAAITGVMTFLVLCFGEISPKTIASRHAESFSLFMVKPLLFLSKILSPIIFVLDIITRGIVRIAGEPKERPLVTEEELKHMVEVGAEEGEIKKKEREMITNIMEFDTIEAKEIMVPRPDVHFVNGKKKIKDIMPELMKKGFSRYPVYDKSPEKVIGTVFIKDLIIARSENKSNSALKKFIHKPLFVPETKRIDKLLPEMQKKKQHMAIVVDEHGNVAGIVTIEDMLEQIVGEIYDETDKVEKEIVKLGSKSARVKGWANIDDVCDKLDLKIEPTESYDTMGGFVLEKAGKIPKKGEVVKGKGFTVTVEKVEGNRIIDLKITKKK